jgi:hypothetical protein
MADYVLALATLGGAAQLSHIYIGTVWFDNALNIST